MNGSLKTDLLKDIAEILDISPKELNEFKMGESTDMPYPIIYH